VVFRWAAFAVVAGLAVGLFGGFWAAHGYDETAACQSRGEWLCDLAGLGDRILGFLLLGLGALVCLTGGLMLA